MPPLLAVGFIGGRIVGIFLSERDARIQADQAALTATEVSEHPFA
jgi:hypothetical protein